MSRREGFLDRWSRLKEAGEAPEAEPSKPAENAPSPLAEADERTDEEVLADLGLPHPDDLKPGDDIAGFMAKAVPERMRRMALRQLWRANPVLANLDGLVEYGEDYTDSAMVVENLQTLYQVGKGMFVEAEEPEVEADSDAGSDAAPEELAGEAGAEIPDQLSEIGEDGESPVEIAPPDQPEVEEPAEMAPQPTRRRMTFS